MNKQYWMDLAEVVNSLRIMPRFLVAVYGAFGIYVADWYMTLPTVERTLEASGFAALILGAFAKLCDWYMQRGGNKQ